MKNVVFVLSGPSGVGKGTIAKRLIKRNKNFSLSVSCTTRSPRPHEENGKDYFFISHEEFDKKIKENGFLEYSEHFGNFYGTPIDFVKEQVKTKDVLLEIDVNGGLNAKKVFKNCILFFILPPSTEELKNRLLCRGSETKEQIETRLDRIDYELSKKSQYDFTIINDDLESAVIEIEKIIFDIKNSN